MNPKSNQDFPFRKVIWASIKIFYKIKYSLIYFSSIVAFESISILCRYLLLKQKLNLDSKNSREVIEKTAIYIIGLDILRLIGYRMGDYLTDVVFVKQQTMAGIMAFKTLLSEKSKSLDLKSGKLQFFIRQGGNGLARLFKNITFLIINETLQLVLTFNLVNDLSGRFFILLLTISCIILMYLHFKITEVKISCKRKSNTAQVECDKALYELILNMDTIKINSKPENEINAYYSKLKKYERAFIKYGLVEDSLDFVHHFIFLLIKSFMFYRTFKETHDKESIPIIIRGLIDTTKTISESSYVIGTVYRKVKEGILNSQMALEYIFEDQSYGMQVHNISGFRSKLVLNNVDIFARDKLILQNVSFEVKKGEKVAIIGKNGFGKSTILRTLLKFQDFQGSIQIDGIPIQSITDKSYRKLFSYMSQNSYLFDDTIKNNILYGVDDPIARENYEDICRELELHESIMTLPDKYDTAVGERGENLSGGQRHKVLLCRSVLRNSEIILFDEPFNNLDEVSIKSFVKMLFGETFKDKTVIMIVHGTDTIDMFDRVININGNTLFRKTPEKLSL